MTQNPPVSAPQSSFLWPKDFHLCNRRHDSASLSGWNRNQPIAIDSRADRLRSDSKMGRVGANCFNWEPVVSLLNWFLVVDLLFKAEKIWKNVVFFVQEVGSHNEKIPPGDVDVDRKTVVTSEWNSERLKRRLFWSICVKFNKVYLSGWKSRWTPTKVHLFVYLFFV